jgi:hypothetical protein
MILDTMPRPSIFVIIACLAITRIAAASNDLSVLVGNWAGSGSGEPGKGVGGFSFTADLQGRVLVRRAHSEYPATASKPAVVHDDLMIVYADQSKAIYFDNEGHVIHYDVTSDPQTKTITMLSTDPSPLPRFRLVYTLAAHDELKVSFDISPTGKTEDLKTYVSGTVTRSK